MRVVSFRAAAAVAPGQCGGDVRHQTDGDGIDEGRRQGEQRHAEGVLAVQRSGGGFRIAQSILQGGHHQRLIQQGDEAHARRAQRDGDAGSQQFTEHGAPRRRYVHGGAVTAAQQEHGQHRQSQQGPCGDAGDGAGGAQGRVRPPVQQHQAQGEADDQLAGRLRHLADGGGRHVAQSLGIAADGGGQADEQHRWAEDPDGGRGQ